MATTTYQQRRQQGEDIIPVPQALYDALARQQVQGSASSYFALLKLIEPRYSEKADKWILSEEYLIPGEQDSETGKQHWFSLRHETWGAETPQRIYTRLLPFNGEWVIVTLSDPRKITAKKREYQGKTYVNYHVQRAVVQPTGGGEIDPDKEAEEAKVEQYDDDL